jgi:DNA-binding transcriptional LysR family regulator
MVEGISSRAIDMAVLLGAPDDKLGEPMPLWRERLHVVLIADHPLATSADIAWADVEGEDFLVSARGAGPEALQLLAARLAGPGRSLATRSHFISRETALSMVGMGLGITLMIESDLGRLPEGVVAVPLASESTALGSGILIAASPAPRLNASLRASTQPSIALKTRACSESPQAVPNSVPSTIALTDRRWLTEGRLMA